MTNRVILSGKVNRAEAKIGDQHSFLRLKVDTGADTVGVSCYLKHENDKDMATFIERMVSQQTTYIMVPNGQESGTERDGEMRFYDVSAFLSDITFSEEPITPMNMAILAGRVIAKENNENSTFIVLSITQPWKEKVFLSRVVSGKIELDIDEEILVMGAIRERFNNEWFHHCEAKNLVKLSYGDPKATE